jgi:Polyketide cyclase / dehydrase and lipid transport
MFPIALIVLAVIAAIVILFLIVVAMQPSQFRVERKATIAAPPAVVFRHVNSFHKWNDWSPWAKLDPSAKNSYDGPEAGTGAKFAWQGNNKVGQGQMTILESRPSDLIRIKLEFIRPFTCTNAAEFTFRPEGNQTAVTWAMTGTNNFMAKAFGLFMNMDKMVGGDFEKGLASLKSLAEAQAK